MEQTSQIAVFGKPFFPKTLISNNELLKTNTYSFPKILLLLILNISLISAPFFMSRYSTKPEDVYGYMPGLEEALIALYEQELPCTITEKTMDCLSIADTTGTYGEYQVYFLPEDLSAISIETSSIVFTTTRISMVYKTENEADDYVLEGDYRFLDGMDFSNINRLDLDMENLSETEFYQKINDTLVQSVLNSTLSGDLLLIYLAQFVQTILYAFMMSVLLLAANFRRSVKRIRYSSSLKYVVVAITGPALLACLVGLVNTTIATIIWSAVYAIRMIVFYSKINKIKDTL